MMGQRKFLLQRMRVSLILIALFFYSCPGFALVSGPYSQGLWAQAYPAEEGLSIDLDALITVVPKDSILAILNPQFEKGIGAEKQMEADEPVMGLSINDESKAYPTNILSAHEIVNDTVGGIPIAITW